MRKLTQYNGGQAMISVTVFFLVISLTIILGMAGPVTRGAAALGNLIVSKESYYLAEAGAEEAIVGTGTISIDGHSPSVSTLSGESTETITSAANWSGSVHTIVVSVSNSTSSPSILSWTESQ